jgi:hypothetical protein
MRVSSALVVGVHARHDDDRFGSKLPVSRLTCARPIYLQKQKYCVLRRSGDFVPEGVVALTARDVGFVERSRHAPHKGCSPFILQEPDCRAL